MKAGAWDYVIKEHIKRLGPAVLNAWEQKRLRLVRKAAEGKSRRWERVFEEAQFGLALRDVRTNTFIEGQRDLRTGTRLHARGARRPAAHGHLRAERASSCGGDLRGAEGGTTLRLRVGPSPQGRQHLPGARGDHPDSGRAGGAAGARRVLAGHHRPRPGRPAGAQTARAVERGPRSWLGWGLEYDPVVGQGTWTDEVYRIYGLSGNEEVESPEQGSRPTNGRSRADPGCLLAAMNHGTPYDLRRDSDATGGAEVDQDPRPGGDPRRRRRPCPRSHRRYHRREARADRAGPFGSGHQPGW